jgi:hypothetical protein
MCKTSSVDLSRRHLIASTISAVPSLVVSNATPLRGEVRLFAAYGVRGDFTRAKAVTNVSHCSATVVVIVSCQELHTLFDTASILYQALDHNSGRLQFRTSHRMNLR